MEEIVHEHIGFQLFLHNYHTNPALKITIHK